MTYEHGISVSEQATSLTPPAEVDSSIPIVVGTAPVEDLVKKPINDPKLIYSYSEFVETFGYDADYTKYTLCEFADVFFKAYSTAPVVFVNVYDPAVHQTEGSPDPTVVTGANVIGGINSNTGKKTGLELIANVFPMFGVIPGLVLSPGFSQDVAVALAMTAKAELINGHFKSLAICDLPTTVAKYSDAPSTKKTNNLVDEFLAVCWPKVKVGDLEHWMSSHLAGVIAKTDAANDGIPFCSPSNQDMKITALKDQFLGLDEANYLNGQGIVTASNFIGGFKAWGSRLSSYPGTTDPKDSFIPIRRMFNFISNELILTFWSKVDGPIRKRLIDDVVDSYNIRLNGLVSAEALIGGRMAFLSSENSTTDIMDGKIKFHLYLTPPGPAKEIDFILEYDHTYLTTLFG